MLSTLAIRVYAEDRTHLLLPTPIACVWNQPDERVPVPVPAASSYRHRLRPGAAELDRMRALAKLTRNEKSQRLESSLSPASVADGTSWPRPHRVSWEWDDATTPNPVTFASLPCTAHGRAPLST